VDENPGTASRYAIQSIPTMMLFKNGNQVDKIAGAFHERSLKVGSNLSRSRVSIWRQGGGHLFLPVNKA